MPLGTLHGVDRHAGSAAVVRGQADNKTADGEPRACAGSVGQAGVRIERCAHLDTALLAAPLTIPTALPRKLLTALPCSARHHVSGRLEGLEGNVWAPAGKGPPPLYWRCVRAREGVLPACLPWRWLWQRQQAAEV